MVDICKLEAYLYENLTGSDILKAKYNFEQDSDNFQFSVCRIGFTGVITGSNVPL
jgi:hypothetical protein